MPKPGPGQFLVRNVFMSVDPYMRGRMMDRESYVPPFQVGQVLDGGSVGQVVESQHAGLRRRRLRLRLRDRRLARVLGLRRHDDAEGRSARWRRCQAYLGVLGMPGLTAYSGLLAHRRSRRKARPSSCRRRRARSARWSVRSPRSRAATSSARSARTTRCAWLRREAGVDAAVNYKTCGNLGAAVKKACPKGIDIYFENVGGEHLEVALEPDEPASAASSPAA